MGAATPIPPRNISLPDMPLDIIGVMFHGRSVELKLYAQLNKRCAAVARTLRFGRCASVYIGVDRVFCIKTHQPVFCDIAACLDSFAPERWPHTYPSVKAVSLGSSLLGAEYTPEQWTAIKRFVERTLATLFPNTQTLLLDLVNPPTEESRRISIPAQYSVTLANTNTKQSADTCATLQFYGRVHVVTAETCRLIWQSGGTQHLLFVSIAETMTSKVAHHAATHQGPAVTADFVELHFFQYTGVYPASTEALLSAFNPRGLRINFQTECPLPPMELALDGAWYDARVEMITSVLLALQRDDRRLRTAHFVAPRAPSWRFLSQISEMLRRKFVTRETLSSEAEWNLFVTRPQK